MGNRRFFYARAVGLTVVAFKATIVAVLATCG